MCEGNAHWIASSTLGAALTGQYRPICSLTQSLPDCPPRRAFEREMNRRFHEDRHCGRIHDIWLIGWLLRGPLPH